jgi:hypothetical protein
MTEEFVTVRGEKYYVEFGKLVLHGLGLTEITEIKGLDQLTNLNQLDLRRNKIKELKGLENCQSLKLQSLYLSGNQIDEIKGLKLLTSLESLDLRSNRIKEIKDLDSLINLQELYLSGNQITEIKGLETLIHLKELDLRRNKISEIKGLENLLNLHTLDLSRNYIEEIKGLEILTKLKELTLWEGLYSAMDVYRAMNYRIWDSNPIRHAERFLILQEPQEIVKYCIAKKEGKFQFVIIEGKKYYFSEGKLNLKEVGIGDIAEIKGLDKLTTLKELDLSFNGLREIKSLEQLIKLEYLDLSWNDFGHPDENGEIKGLDGLETLLSLKNLKKLKLWGNYILREDLEKIETLEKNLPNLRIDYPDVIETYYAYYDD